VTDGSPTVRSSGGDVTLRVQRDATLQGTVRDEQGAPVPMFSVLLQSKQGALELNAVEPLHVVDADGAFLFGNLSHGLVRGRHRRTRLRTVDSAGRRARAR
jgi:hypothetical protein